MLQTLTSSFRAAELAVLAAEASGRPTDAMLLVSALVERLQSGDDSIGVRGSDLALAQSKANKTGDPELWIAVVEAQKAYTLAFDMYDKVEAEAERQHFEAV